MRSVELFTGCGGLALGLSRAGFHHELMVEFNADAVATVECNDAVEHVRDWPIKHSDVREIDWTPYAGVDLVAGGPPCQPFSIGGKHKGHGDVRDMWPEAIRAVREIRPRAFLFENVRGLARPAFSEYLRWIRTHIALPQHPRRDCEGYEEHVARLEANADQALYDVTVLVVNAADYGAAQKRNRVLVVGVRRDLGITLGAPKNTHSFDRLVWDKWVTGAYWKRHDLEKPPESHIERAEANAAARLRQSGNPPPGKAWVTVRDVLDGLGEPTGRSNHVFQPGARTYVGHTGSPLDLPAKALKAGDHGVPGGENMMVQDNGTVRYFTVRESCRLQGLPDEYIFPRSWSESMRQLGNAVPAQLSETIGRWLGSALENPDRREATVNGERIGEREAA